MREFTEEDHAEDIGGLWDVDVCEVGGLAEERERGGWVLRESQLAHQICHSHSI
jgi:hypothetical protein